MSNTATVDYDALAQQARGAVDYDALASQARGGAPDLSKLSPEMRANYIRNVSPTQFEAERSRAVEANGGTPVLPQPTPSVGTMAHMAASDVSSGVKNALMNNGTVPAVPGGVGVPGVSPADKYTGASRSADEARKKAGHGVAYRTAAAVAPLVGVDPEAVEHAGDTGDTNQVLARTAPQAALAAAPMLGEAADAAAPMLGDAADAARSVAKTVAPSVATPIEELTSTQPARLAELKQFPQKVAAVQQTVREAEAAAKAKAKAAFPQIDKPITLDAGEPAVSTGVLDVNGNPVTQGGRPAVTTTWDALQEQRSDLLKNIAKEKVAIARGQKPAFDIGDMYDELNKLDNTMSKAALDQGGVPALEHLEAARAQWRQYMNDFHNQGSPLRDILEAKPDETAKIVGKLTGRDSGPRALETLRRHGADTTHIEQLLSRGKQPLAVDVTESGKLRAAGSDANYQRQRLNESLQQATNNRMPPRAEATLPSNVMSSKPPSVLGTDFPKFTAPRTVTKFRLKRALKSLDGSPTP